VATGQLSASLVRTAAFGALVLCVPMSFLNGISSGWAHLGLVGSGWVYNLGLKRTAWSWFPYALGFGLLPAFVTLGLPSPIWPPTWALAAGSLLGVGAHFANVLPDIEADLAHGVLGLPQRMGRTSAGALSIGLLVLASALLIFAPTGAPTGVMWFGAIAVLLLVVRASLSLAGRGDASAVFSSAMLIALVNALLLANSAMLVVV
jgi:4-hydroxybenzoate polyprenyltransferase